jgi:hypothetical protein
MPRIYKGKTQYTNVYQTLNSKKEIVYYFHINRRTRTKDMGISSKTYTDIKECAIAVDKWLINNGEEPINILKKKTDE